jgi:hypothetical protein
MVCLKEQIFFRSLLSKCLAQEKDHNIAGCSKLEVSKQVYQNQTVRFGKLEYPVSVENYRTSG